MNKQQRLYDARFYRDLETTRDSAREILPIVFELLKPASIVDIGCGAGHWLAAAMDLGLNDVLGVDGEWALTSKLEIPRDKFLAHDLTTPLQFDRKFDLAFSLEVAEHLPESQARAFVQDLCGSADKVLFSAAIPGQGGRHHVNEQWPAYWAHLFADCGFQCYDVLRPRIWSNPRVVWYYAQNCLIFARAQSIDQRLFENSNATAEPLALVHPILWSAQVERMNSPGKLLERLPKVILSRLIKKRRWSEPAM
jgi:SAM-dependent methyltransferase